MARLPVLVASLLVMEAMLLVLVASLLGVEARLQVFVASLLGMVAMLQVLVASLLFMEARLLPMGLQMQAPVLTCQLMPPLSQFASRRRHLRMQAPVLAHQFTPPLSQLTSRRRQMSYNWMTTTKMMITLSTRHQHLGEQSRGHPA
jgi:hypothetical protein